MLYMYSKETLMLAIRLPKEIEERLDLLAKKTGRTKTFYAREAILEYLDDLEDAYIAEKRYADIQSGKVQTIPFAEMKHRYSDDD